MFCSNCGEKAKENARFCHRCGFTLEEVAKDEFAIAEKAEIIGEKITNAETVVEKESTKKRKGLRGKHIALICAGGILWLMGFLVIIIAPSFREKEDPAKILYEAHQQYIGSDKTYEEYLEEQAQQEDRTKNESLGGAESLDELKGILSSSRLWDEEALRCATTFTQLCMSTECEDGTLHLVADRDIEGMCDVINDFISDDGTTGDASIKINGYVECENEEIYSNFTVLSQALEVIVECAGDDLSEEEETAAITIGKRLTDESRNMEGVWRASYTWINSGYYGQVSAAESSLYIYKINGRYYWQAIEVI